MSLNQCVPIFITAEKMEERQRMNNRNLLIERFSIKLDFVGISDLRFLRDNLYCYIMETNTIMGKLTTI